MGLLGKVKQSKAVKVDLKKIPKDRTKIKVTAHPKARKKEVAAFKKEVKETKTVKKKKEMLPIVPVYVSQFDDLIERHGFEKGSTILISGGAGSGKTTFCMQSLYHAIKKGEKVIYISTEEEVGKLKHHMKLNYKWDFAALEKEGKIAFLQLDAIQIARDVEASLLQEKKKLEIDFEFLVMPFTPDRIVFDSLSSLSIAFENTESYRKYINYLFSKLEEFHSLNLMITETEQNPSIYSRAGVEEFLADGVVVLYNIKTHAVRQNALEILKLRASKHLKKLVPYMLTENGFEIYPEQDLLE